MPKPRHLETVALEEETAADDTKAQLQGRVEQARESIAQTVDQIKGTVEEQVDSVRETFGAVLSFRQGFQNDPMVWSLGALSAGFALGYTLGYANKRRKAHGRLPAPVNEFIDDLERELSKVGKDLVLPSLDAHIKASLGFDLASALEEMSGKPKRHPPRAPTKRRISRPSRKPPLKRRTRTKPH